MMSILVLGNIVIILSIYHKYMWEPVLVRNHDLSQMKCDTSYCHPPSPLSLEFPHQLPHSWPDLVFGLELDQGCSWSTAYSDSLCWYKGIPGTQPTFPYWSAHCHMLHCYAELVIEGIKIWPGIGVKGVLESLWNLFCAHLKSMRLWWSLHMAKRLMVRPCVSLEKCILLHRLSSKPVSPLGNDPQNWV